MKLGIVGLPNVGKSTLFNSLTKAGAESANYPFCTIDPNVGVVAVPDERLKLLGDMYHSKKVTPAVIEFVDIAGLIFSTQRFSDTDFLCSFSDRHQHDIHDTNATNDQGNCCNKGNCHSYYINDCINNAHIRRHIVCCDLPFFIFRIFVCKKALNICFCLLLIRTCF